MTADVTRTSDVTTRLVEAEVAYVLVTDLEEDDVSEL